MKRIISPLFSLALTLVPLALAGCGQPEAPTFTVMARKLYGGADPELQEVFTAMTADQFAVAVDSFSKGLLERSFAQRSQLIADEIKEVRPDFVGVQEGITIYTQTPPDGSASKATKVELDYIQLLLDALRSRGENYEVTSRQAGIDVEFKGKTADLRYASSEVILVRSDLTARGFKLENQRGGLFQTTCVLPSQGGEIPVKRGWAAVDVTANNNQRFRLFSSHLDFTCVAFDPKIQQGQGDELIRAVGGTDPLILVADLNSNADTSGASSNPLTTTLTYSNFIKAGLFDSWRGDKGFNCCFDDDLKDPKAMLDQRIDYIFNRGGFTVEESALTGNTKQTPQGYWPSNHAGLWSRIKFQGGTP